MSKNLRLYLFLLFQKPPPPEFIIDDSVDFTEPDDTANKEADPEIQEEQVGLVCVCEVCFKGQKIPSWDSPFLYTTRNHAVHDQGI